MRNLLSLPAELLASILSYLDSFDLLSCSASSKHLSRLISDSSKLQYTISLSKHRLLDVLPSYQNPPYATRLKILREREQAWRNLQWKGRHILQLPPTGSVYEFVGGIYGNGREDENRVTASISFLELPTCASGSDVGCDYGCGWRGDRKGVQPVSGSALRTWTHAMGDVAIIDFTMDPSQNLLVLVALAPSDSKHIYNLHLRTISTNEPHPKAPLPILSCLERHPTIPPPPELFAAVRVQVSGDLVGLLIKEAPDPVGAHLEIWNWENDPYYPASRFEVFTFPDPLTSPTPVLSRTNHSTSSPSVNSTKNGCHPIRKYSYDFPELSNGYMYWYISMSCNPAPGYIPSQGGRVTSPFPPSMQSPGETTDRDTNNGDIENYVNHAAKQLYYPLPDERIHACCIYIFNPNNHTHIAAANNVANNIVNGNPSSTNHTNNANAAGAMNNHLNANIAPNGNAHATTANTTTGHNATTNLGNANFLTDDDLDDENQQVHSFVFFLNLKTLLEPPKEWFHWSDKVSTSTTLPTSSTNMSSSPFAALASKLGPLWKNSSSSTPSSPSGSTHFSSNSDAGARAGAEVNYSAMSLESSLNALKRTQEEKELRDAKVMLDAVNSNSVNGKGKKKKRGGVSSSLSVEIPIGGSGGPVQVPVSGGARSPILAKSRSLQSSPSSVTPHASGSGTVAPTSSGTSAYPLFPTFSSPYPLTSGSKSYFRNANGHENGSSTKPSLPLANTGSNSFTFGSIPTREEDATMTPTEPPSPPEHSPSRTTTSMASGIGSAAFTRPISPGPVMTSASFGSGSSSSSLSGSATVSSTFTGASSSSSTSTSASASHAASPSKTRSASTPPTYTSSHAYNRNHSNSNSNSSNSNLNNRRSFTTAPSSQPLPSPSTTTSAPSTITSARTTHTTWYNNCSYSPHRHSQPIPWEVWGPSSTRWFEECLSTDWQHAIYGLRTVESVSVRERERMTNRTSEREREVNGAGKRSGKQQNQESAGASVIASVNGKGKGKGNEVVNEKERQGGYDEMGTLQGMGRVNGGKKGKGKGKGKENVDVLNDDAEAVPEEEESSSEDQGYALDEETANNDRLSLEGLPVNGNNPSAISNNTAGPSTLITVSNNGINGTITPAQTTGLPVRRRPRRFLRVRDFNPYSLKQAEAEAEAQIQTIAHVNGVHTDSMTSSTMSKSKGKQRALPSPSPPPSSHSYSYPYPIHLNINSNFSYPWLPNSLSSLAYSSSQVIADSSPNAMTKDDSCVWGKRRVIREPSITPVKGVFKKDIVSWLPYTEVVSEETFEVTDVMMDDCRLLLLKRGQMGRLESVEVLMM